MTIVERLLAFLRGPHRLTPAEFLARREASHPVLDVRTPREFEQERLEGAIHVDIHAPDFAQRIERLKMKGTIEADQPIYLYCRSGARSGRATRLLRAQGYEQAYNVGGLRALIAAGAKATR